MPERVPRQEAGHPVPPGRERYLRIRPENGQAKNLTLSAAVFRPGSAPAAYVRPGQEEAGHATVGEGHSGWAVGKVDRNEASAAVDALEDLKQIKGRPAVLIARTVASKCASFVEGNFCSHSRVPVGEELATALRNLLPVDVTAGEA